MPDPTAEERAAVQLLAADLDHECRVHPPGPVSASSCGAPAMTAAARFFSDLRRQLAGLTAAEREALLRAGARALTRIDRRAPRG